MGVVEFLYSIYFSQLSCVFDHSVCKLHALVYDCSDVVSCLLTCAGTNDPQMISLLEYGPSSRVLSWLLSPLCS